MKSGIYSGTLMHGRMIPKHHSFVVRLKMILLNLDELETFFAKSKFWALEKIGLVSFKRNDYLPDQQQSLKEAVINTVKEETGEIPLGPVFMLTNLRYWGFQFNPASFFYCFDKDEKALTHILIEVHNTPWSERHRYVLSLKHPNQKDFVFNKVFHVSPFNPMDMEYHCAFSTPGDSISVRMENHKDNKQHFKAVLKLKREAIDTKMMTKFAINAWAIPLKIAGGIYWQATKLFFKGVPFYHHP